MSEMKKRVVRLWVETERWRYHCPRDHTSWVPNKTSFYCSQCGEAYSALVDTSTGEMVQRSEFHFLGNRFGPPPENVQSMLTEY